MTVTTISGVEYSTDNTANNVRDMADKIALLEPNSAPLLALMSKLGSTAAKNPKVEWKGR